MAKGLAWYQSTVVTMFLRGLKRGMAGSSFSLSIATDTTDTFEKHFREWTSPFTMTRLGKSVEGTKPDPVVK
jgi:hypothetical protein